MLVIEEKEPEMNTQSDSAIIAKLFSIYFLLSTFHIYLLLITCNEIFIHILSI
mgnify:CR=1 FL=1